ncbi:outer membrane homotrimeric porin [Megalodesulfovibrio paquesii]
MKRIMTLALAALFVLGSIAMAQAVEVKVKGSFQFNWSYIDLGSFGPSYSDTDHFDARQRTRVQVDFIASENLQGILMFEIGEIRWGNTATSGRGSGGALGADGVNVETKRAFIQFNIPDTDLLFSVGIQGLATPGVIAGSPLFDDDVAAVLAQYPINDMITVGAFWARLYNLTTSGNPDPWDEFDMFGILAPIKGDGWMIHPYVVGAVVGRDYLSSSFSTGTTNSLIPPALMSGAFFPGNLDQRTFAWWAGSTFVLDMFDPFTFMVEGLYGSVEAEAAAADRRGFYVAAEIDYALDFMTVGVMGWYASGEDSSWRNGSEQMPSVSGDWNPSSFAWDGGSLLSSGGFLAGTAGLDDNNPMGKWGVALLLKDISFVEDLTHQIRFIYGGGTNSPKSRRIRDVTAWGEIISPVSGIELTSDDMFFEVNFDHEYKLYENLAVILELGLMTVDYGNTLYAPADDATGFKIAWGLNYKF